MKSLSPNDRFGSNLKAGMILIPHSKDQIQALVSSIPLSSLTPVSSSCLTLYFCSSLLMLCMLRFLSLRCPASFLQVLLSLLRTPRLASFTRTVDENFPVLQTVLTVSSCTLALATIFYQASYDANLRCLIFWLPVQSNVLSSSI